MTITLIHVIEAFVYAIKIENVSECFFVKQRHNIFKKRLDPSGKVIEAPKADTINSPKVFFVHLSCNSWFCRIWEDLVAACCRYFL